MDIEPPEIPLSVWPLYRCSAHAILEFQSLNRLLFACNFKVKNHVNA